MGNDSSFVGLPTKTAGAAKVEAPVSPLPWELIPGTEHHGPYIVNSYGGTVCDLYAMSNPLSLSVRNGGDSTPIWFTDAEGNAALIAHRVNAHDELVAALRLFVEAAEAGWSLGTCIEVSRAVIAKATQADEDGKDRAQSPAPQSISKEGMK